MTRKRFLYGIEQPEMIPRIECECGWFNNTPSKKKAPYYACKKCGRLVDEKERFKRKLRGHLWERQTSTGGND